MNYLTAIPDELIFYIHAKVLLDILKSQEFTKKKFDIITRKMSQKQRQHLLSYWQYS